MQNYYGTFFLCLILVILLFYSILGIVALIFDGVSLCIVKNTLGRDLKNQITKKHFGLIFAFTIISYCLSIFGMFIMFSVGNGDFSILTFLLVIYRIVTEPVTNPQATPFFMTAIGIAIVANLIFNYFIVFGKVPFSRIKRLFSALIVSILTAPYLFCFSFTELIDFLFEILY